jgi:hypothetical protein
MKRAGTSSTPSNPSSTSAGFAAQMLLEAPPSAARDALLARIADGSAIAALAASPALGA